MIDPSQCRAARALIEMSRETLASRAKVAERTIADFEAGRRKPVEATLTAVRGALERAGVVFVPENGGGSGVRRRRRIVSERRSAMKKGAR